MTCFKGSILHLLPIHLFLPHFLSTLLPFLIYNSTSDASLPHSSPSLPPPVFSYLLLFPAHYFTFNSCLTFILCFPSSVPVSPTTTQYVLPLIAHLIISSISLFHLLSLISLHIFFCTHPCFSSILHFHPSLLLLCLFKGCILKLNPADFSSSLSFPLFSSPAPCHYCFSVLSFFSSLCHLLPSQICNFFTFPPCFLLSTFSPPVPHISLQLVLFFHLPFLLLPNVVSPLLSRNLQFTGFPGHIVASQRKLAQHSPINNWRGPTWPGTLSLNGLFWERSMPACEGFIRASRWNVQGHHQCYPLSVFIQPSYCVTCSLSPSSPHKHLQPSTYSRWWLHHAPKVPQPVCYITPLNET